MFLSLIEHFTSDLLEGNVDSEASRLCNCYFRFALNYVEDVVLLCLVVVKYDRFISAGDVVLGNVHPHQLIRRVQHFFGLGQLSWFDKPVAQCAGVSIRVLYKLASDNFLEFFDRRYILRVRMSEKGMILP